MFYVHEEFPEHEKLEPLEDDPVLWAKALSVWLAAGCDCRKRLTDGRISAKRLARITPLGEEAIVIADVLVDRKLWEKPKEGHYLFHDWADVQETKEQVKARRKKDRDKKRRQRGRGTPLDQPAGESLGESPDVSPEVVPGGTPVGSPGKGSGVGTGDGIPYFSLKWVASRFGELRKAAGGHGYAGTSGDSYPITDYTKLEYLTGWARDESDGDAARAMALIDRSLAGFFANSAAAERGFPFAWWAKDPGSCIPTAAADTGAGTHEQHERDAEKHPEPDFMRDGGVRP